MNKQNGQPGSNSAQDGGLVSLPADAATSALGLTDVAEDDGWKEFREQCRRQMQRPLDQRIKYGFCRMYKPVLDDAAWRAFDTMAEYRAWCAAHLPAYLGFQAAKP